jgi:hypothetical protein
MAGRDRTRQQALHAVGEYRALPAFRPVGLDDPYPGQRLCQPGSHPGSYQAAFAKERPALAVRAHRGTEPQVKGLTVMVNSMYNGWRMEDVWLDK